MDQRVRTLQTRAPFRAANQMGYTIQARSWSLLTVAACVLALHGCASDQSASIEQARKLDSRFCQQIRSFRSVLQAGATTTIEQTDQAILPIIGSLRGIAGGYRVSGDRLAENAVGQLASDLEAIVSNESDGDLQGEVTFKIVKDIHMVDSLRHLDSPSCR